jgi:hypothetical protein
MCTVVLYKPHHCSTVVPSHLEEEHSQKMCHFLHSKTCKEWDRLTCSVQYVFLLPCGTRTKFKLNVVNDFAADFRPGSGDFSLLGSGFRVLYALFM